MNDVRYVTKVEIKTIDGRPHLLAEGVGFHMSLALTRAMVDDIKYRIANELEIKVGLMVIPEAKLALAVLDADGF